MTSVLFLHGGALNKKMWQPQINQLSGLFDIHTIDLPGHGESINKPFTFDSAVKEIHQYVQKNIKGKIVIVGLSLGGYVALAYSQKHQNNIERLVLSGCCIQYVNTMGILAKINSYILTFISRKRFQSIQQKQLLDITMPDLVTHIVTGGISLAGARDSMREIIGIDFTRFIKECYVPILLINGESDKLNRKNEYRYSDVYPELIVEKIENAGHLCSLEQPTIFSNTVAKFIQNDA